MAYFRRRHGRGGGRWALSGAAAEQGLRASCRTTSPWPSQPSSWVSGSSSGRPGGGNAIRPSERRDDRSLHRGHPAARADLHEGRPGGRLHLGVSAPPGSSARASRWRRGSWRWWASTSSTTGGTGSATRSTSCGPRTSSTTRARTTTWRWRCGRRSSRPWTALPLHLVLAVARGAAPGGHRGRLHQHPLPVLDPHRAGGKAGLVRALVQHALPSPRPPRHQPAVPGQELREISSSGIGSSGRSRSSPSRWSMDW